MEVSGIEQLQKILVLIGFLALPLGFLVSTGVAIVKTEGPRRKISILGLCLTVIFLILLYVLENSRIHIPYHTRNFLAGITGCCAAATIFCAYLAHTYWPTQLRAVNTPATIGMGCFCLTITTMFISSI
ncbi:MAG: hypothetical protein ACPGUX_11140 [Halocynthiibacter sp.]